MTAPDPPPQRTDSDGRLTLRELAEGCCRQYALPEDAIDDIVFDAQARVGRSADHGDVIAVVDELARAEADRYGRRCVAFLEPGGGVPTLMPAFVDLGAKHARPRQLHRALGSAAVAVAEDALDADRFFLFFLAWIQAKPLARILARVGEAGDGMMLRRRLRRLSDTVQRRLFRTLDRVLPDREGAWLRAVAGAPRGRTRPTPALPPVAESWTILLASLDEVIHNGEAPKTTRPLQHADAGQRL